MDLNVKPECAPVSDDMNNQGIDPQPLSAESDPSSSMHLTLSSSHEAVDIESPSDVINIQSTDPQVVAAELDTTVASSSMNVVQSSSHGIVGIEQGHAPSDDMNDTSIDPTTELDPTVANSSEYLSLSSRNDTVEPRTSSIHDESCLALMSLGDCKLYKHCF